MTDKVNKTYFIIMKKTLSIIKLEKYKRYLEIKFCFIINYL